MPAPTTPETIKNAILDWGWSHGIVATTVPLPSGTEEFADLPFTEEHAAFFRTRRIVRVTTESEAKEKTVTVYSRLAIASPKIKELKRVFDARFADAGIGLELSVGGGFKVDHSVDSSGRFVPIHYRGRRIACGSSVGVGNQRNAGTLTALAKRKGDPESIYGLSCNHVVGGCSTVRPGTPIVVPGIQDVSPEHKDIIVIGDHVTAAFMAQGRPDVADISRNRDLACFRLRDPRKVSSRQGSDEKGYDTPKKFAVVKKGLNVKKWGRSTGLTMGVVSNLTLEHEPVPYTIISHYGPTTSQTFRGSIYFGTVFEVSSSREFSLGGDSGALVVTDDGKPERVVGIVIAGAKRKSVVLPLQPALDELELTLLSGHNA